MPTANIYQSEFTGQQMDAKFTAVAELQTAITELQAAVNAKYSKPSAGIPSTDLDADVNAALAKANSAIQSLADYYTKAEVDALIATINGQEYVDVSSLPTASASTMGKIYLVGPDGSGYYSYYYTSYDGSDYSWVGPLGTTQISLANYATKTELGQLEQEVDGLREDVGEKDSRTIRHNVASSTDFTNTGNGVVADSNSADFGKSAGSSSWSSTGYVDISAYAGKTLTYLRRLTASSNALTRSFGLVFYSGQNVADAIEGQTFKYDAGGSGGEMTDIQIPASAKYARFTYYGASISEFTAYVDEIVDNGYISGIGKDVQDMKPNVAALLVVTGLAPIYFRFVESSGTNHNKAHFMVYCQVSGTTYARYRIGLYNASVQGPTTSAKCYWRLEDVEFCTFDGTSFTTISGAHLLANGENEFVLRQTSPNKTDYTGGYHGDEYIYDENGDLITGAFAEFFADGALLDLSADIDLTACSSFFYKERSPMFETANSGDDQTDVGRLIAWHQKETRFSSEGYHTVNRIDFIEGVQFYALPGICCVDRYVSQYAMGEGDALTSMGTGDPAIPYQFSNYGNSKIFYKGNGYQVDVESHILFGDDDGAQRLYVYNVTQYNKYYRETQTINGVANETKLKAETVMRVRKL